ncbi:MAG: type I restriction endonuclease subunit R, partial [Calditrichaeota bacterium]|nr:type I restriction endonuclease subunit R [Calditrichota bacterium]
EQREAFYRYFREIEEIYEILSPDPFLRPYLEDYQRLVEMYRLLRNAYEPHVPVDRSFLRKTAEIVQQHSRTDAIREPQVTYEISPGALLALLNEEKPETVKVFNLLKELHRLVADQGRIAPYLLSIGERAEEIRRRFEERLIEAQQALQELEVLVKQLKDAEKERRTREDLASHPYAPQAFAVEWWLRTHQVSPEQARQVAQTMESAFAAFPHWLSSRQQESELRRELYKALLDVGISDVVAWADAILNLLRRAAE